MNNKINKNHITDLSVYYAFQSTFNFGSLVWKLHKKDIDEIKSLLDFDDYDKTGEKLWKWFYKKYNRNFITFKKMGKYGETFFDYISKYNS